MSTSLATIGTSADGGAVTLDPHTLVTTRLLVTANSGGGKSYLLRKLIEQIGQTAQTFVLDLEGEFATLREKLDLVIVGSGGEIPAEVASAGLLARRLMEKGISAVIDLSDLKFHDRRAFVRRFLESLMELPKSLWHPLFVVLDEAHQFAPEKGMGEAESLQAVRDLCTLGRKRGYCAILATQRISTLDKSCAGECNNKFIGRMTLDVDVKRAAFELGVAAPVALKMLRDLDKGEFHAFGPAIQPSGVTLLNVGKVETTHPKAGQGQSLKPPRPSSAITAVVGELADLKKQAETEVKDLAAAMTKIADLERQLKAKPLAAPAQVKEVEKPVITDKQLDRLEKLQATIVAKVDAWWTRAADGVNPLIELLKGQGGEVGQLIAAARAVRAAPAAPPVLPRATMAAKPVVRPVAGAAAASPSNGGLDKCARAILSVLSQYPDGCMVGKLTLLAGYRYSGGFRNALSELRTRGFIVGDNAKTMTITELGLQQGPFTELPSGQDLIDHWTEHSSFDKAARGVLVQLVNHPQGLTADQLCELTGYTFSGGFRNALSTLRTAGVLFGKNGETMTASDELLAAKAASSR